MNLTKSVWQGKDYEEFRQFLEGQGDEQYRDFHSKLVPDGLGKMIGVRIPVMRKMAKEIAKGDYAGFLRLCEPQYYEEIMIKGLVIGYSKADFETALEMIDSFVPEITNWAVCDSFCSGLKVFLKKPEEGFAYLQKYRNSSETYCLRFLLVMLLDYYVKEDYLPQIFDICSEIKHESYYVKMANAWLLSVCCVKFPEETEQFLKGCELDDFTFRKTISKICDSYRVGKEEKERLKRLRELRGMKNEPH